MFERINLKDTSIQIVDINQLTLEQINLIKSVSETKTIHEWRDPENKDSVKFRLTEKQKEHVLNTKSYITEGRKAIELLLEDIIEFSLHAKERAVWRIENRPPDTNIKVATQLKLVDAFIKSSTLEDYAEWKGYPQISYNFSCDLEGKNIIISVAFRETVFFVTVIDPTTEKGEFGFAVRHNLPKSVIEKLKKIKGS